MTVWLHESFPRQTYRRRRVSDAFLGVILGAGIAASLLLALAMVLGAGWLVVRIAIEIGRLVGGD